MMPENRGKYSARNSERIICRILQGKPVTWPPFAGFAEDSFLETCLQNGVAALVYHELKKGGGIAGVPPRLREELKRQFLRFSAIELARTSELTNIIQASADKGIYPLLIKGAGISQTHYPFPGLRDRCDTDLFISVESLEPFRRLMRDLGYTIDPPFYKSHQLSCRFVAGGSRDSFDVHWRINNYARYARIFDYREAREQSVTIAGMPGEPRTLNSRYGLLLACIHLAANPEHDRNRLIWLYDIHLLAGSMKSEEMVDFAVLAVEKQVQKECLTVLWNSAEKFNTFLPERALRILQTPPADETFSEHFSRSNIGLLYNDLKILSGWRQKLGLVKELFFPSGQELLSHYNASKRILLPWFYLRYLVTGVVKRLSLR